MSYTTPASRLHRTVRKLSRFSITVPASALEQIRCLLPNDEHVLGCYLGNHDVEHIFFTDSSAIFTDRKEFKILKVPYSAINDIDFPLPASPSIDLTLCLHDGTAKFLRVIGVAGNTRDVFEVGRFFLRVVADLKNLNLKNEQL